MLKKDKIQLDITIGSNAARLNLSKLEAEAAKLKNRIKQVKAEHVRYDKAAASLKATKKNLTDSQSAGKKLESKLALLKEKHKGLASQIKITGDSDKKLITKEKELANSIKLVYKELELERLKYVRLSKSHLKYEATMNRMKSSHTKFVRATNKLAKVEENIKKVRNAFSLTEMTIQQLGVEAKQLGVLLKKAVPDSSDYKKYETRLIHVNNRLKDLKEKSLKAAKAQMTLKDRLRKTADSMNQFGMMVTTIIAALVGIVAGIKSVIDGLATFSDVASEVRKTTGLTKDEIEELRASFKTFNTRTGSKALLEFSRIAGKLGITGVEDISKFVKQANIAVVSLGKSLGNSADETINTLGKIIGAFNLEKTMGWGDAIKHVGAVINELGKSSTASEKPIVEYISRMSSVGVASNIAIPKIAAIGSTLDSLKVPAERGSSAMMTFIYSLSKNIEKFSSLLGVSEKRYKEMLDNDVNDVMIQVLKSAKNGREGLLGITEALDDADVSGISMTATVGTLMNNIDELERQQAIATDEFKKGTSTLSEYELMNNNFAATTEKTRKKIKGLFIGISQQLEPAILKAMKTIVYIISNIRTFAKVTLIAVAALLSYKAAAKLASISISDLKKAIQAARKAMQAFNLTSKLNVWGLLAAAIATAVVAYYAFRDEINQTQKVIDEFNKSLVEEKANHQKLFNELYKTKEGTRERKELITEVNKQYGKYLPNLLTERSSLAEITRAQILSNIALEKNLAIKMQQTAVNETLQRNIKKRAELSSELIQLATRDNKYITAQVTTDLNNLIDLSLKGNKIATSEFNQFVKKYNTQKFLEGREFTLKLHLKTLIEYERTKNNDLKNIEASFSGFMKGAKKSTYNQERLALRTEYYKKTELEKGNKKGLLDVEKWYQDALVKLREKYNINYNHIKVTKPKNPEKPKGTGDKETKPKKDYYLEALLKLRAQTKKVYDGMIVDQEDKLNLERQNEIKALDSYFNNLTKKQDGDIKKTVEYKEAVNSINVKYDKLAQKQLEENQSKETELKFKSDLAFLELKKLQGQNVLEETFNKELEYLDWQHSQKLVSESDFQLKKQQIENKYFQDKKAYEIEMFEQTTFESFEAELIALEELHEAKIFSVKEYEERKKKIEDKFNAESLKKINQFFDISNKLSGTALKFAESKKNKELKIITDKEAKELKLAGDNEAKKELITLKYKQQKEAIESAYNQKQQRNAIISSVVSGAEGIIKTGANLGYPLAIPFQILQGVETAASIALIKSQQYRKGKYPVLGADDNKLYEADYVEKLSTGIVNTPVLVAEEPEMVVDNQTLYNPQTDVYGNTVLDYAKLITSMKHGRHKQFAEGKYPEMEVQKKESFHDSNYSTYFVQIITEIKEMKEEINNLKNIRATIVFDELKEAEETIKDITTKTSL